jgi:transcriptional regulator with XRE-family HTH domain
MREDERKQVSKLIRMLREQHDLSNTDLAEAVGVHQNTVTKHLSGRQAISLGHLRLYAKLFGVTVDYLLEAEGVRVEKHNSLTGKLVTDHPLIGEKTSSSSLEGKIVTDSPLDGEKPTRAGGLYTMEDELVDIFQELSDSDKKTLLDVARRFKK